MIYFQFLYTKLPTNFHDWISKCSHGSWPAVRYHPSSVLPCVFVYNTISCYVLNILLSTRNVNYTLEYHIIFTCELWSFEYCSYFPVNYKWIHGRGKYCVRLITHQESKAGKELMCNRDEITNIYNWLHSQWNQNWHYHTQEYGTGLRWQHP